MFRSRNIGFQQPHVSISPGTTTASVENRIPRRSPFMELPTEIRCEIYCYLLTIQHGTTHATISATDFIYRAVIRKARRESPGTLDEDRKRVKAEYLDDIDLPERTKKTMLEYDGNDEPLLQIQILRVCRQVYQEAKPIMYKQNAFYIDSPGLLPAVPFHHHFFAGWDLSEIRHLRLDLDFSHYSSCLSSRAYGTWSTFLLLPALKEITIVVRFVTKGYRFTDRQRPSWPTLTYCAPALPNILAAIPASVKIKGAGDSIVGAHLADEHCQDYATTEQLEELFKSSGDIRGVDAEVWKNDMECMGQSLVGRTSSCIEDFMQDVRPDDVVPI
ncbi:hypothetical protein BDU57DRAFT_439360 [Ampelomyces quisqualis]|uniref:DUF7730 domain-containing protein n=1 Tax=Ampelomyces quisqualis TaxID=50730 RepID=A0A6A5R4Y8_AMPQU|nr:hypothetical protein BDU57DRAFT_439360 [Ampelomyces quisqualis]